MRPRHIPAWLWGLLLALAIVVPVTGLSAAAAPRPARTYNLSPSPDAAEQARDAARYADVESGAFVGAKISAGANQFSTEDPLAFDHAKFDTAGLWDPAEPTRLTIPADGFYRVQAQVTVLGSGYEGSPPAPDVAVLVIRNGDAHDFVCGDRDSQAEPTVAQLLECSTVDWFLAGDYLEVLVTPNRTVESNWPGRGNVSPLLTVTREG